MESERGGAVFTAPPIPYLGTGSALLPGFTGDKSHPERIQHPQNILLCAARPATPGGTDMPPEPRLGASGRSGLLRCWQPTVVTVVAAAMVVRAIWVSLQRYGSTPAGSEGPRR